MTRANHQMLTERESEINHVVKSIQDFNELFKDLAVMIEDQGTIVDRIDYNIEKVSHSVQHGLTELEKASKYQKTSRKMYFIAFLIVLFLVLFILLVITKF
jgi:syntaxin 16